MKTLNTTTGKHPYGRELQLVPYAPFLTKAYRGWLMDGMSGVDIAKDDWGGVWPQDTVASANGNAYFTCDENFTGYQYGRYVPSPIGYGMQLNVAAGDSPYIDTLVPAGATSYDTDTVRNAFSSGGTTTACWFRVEGEQWDGPYGVIHAFAGLVGDGVAAENDLFILGCNMDASGVGKLHVRWEWGTGGTEYDQQLDNYRIIEGQWYYSAWTFDNLSGGTCDAKLYINGELVFSLTGINHPASGTNARWTIGCRQAAVVNDYAQRLPCTIGGLYCYGGALTPAMISEDYRRGILYDSFTSVDTRLTLSSKVNYPAPTAEAYYSDSPDGFLDLTNYLDTNWVTRFSLSEDTENNVTNSSFSVVKRKKRANTSPLITDSAVNQLSPLNNVAATVISQPLLSNSGASGGWTGGGERVVMASMARCPLGQIGNDYMFIPVFQGLAETIDEGSLTECSVDARDYGSWLINSFTEEEVEYGSTAGVSVTSVLQSALNDNNSVVPDAKFGSYPFIGLTTIGNPNWLVNAFKRKREPVMAMLESIATQLGWKLKFKFVQSALVNDYRLCFYEPERYNSLSVTGGATSALDNPVATVLLSSAQITDLSQGKLSIERIRNVVRIAYPSAETTQVLPGLPVGIVLEANGLNGIDNEGNRTPAYIQYRNTSSASIYGRRFMEVQEDSTSQIDTVAEAHIMALAALTDLSRPDLDSSISCLTLFEIEEGDVVAIPSNDEYNTATQSVAVKQISTDVSNNSSTSLTVHGKPSLGFKAWLAIDARPGLGPPPILGPSGVLAGRTFTSDSIGYAAINDLTTFGLGGLFLSMRNPEFSIFSMGLNNPPTGWEVFQVGAIWNTNVFRSTDSQSGNSSVRVDSAVNFNGLRVKSPDDLIPITGNIDQPFVFTVTWKRPAGVTNDQMGLGWNFYEADKTTLAGTGISLHNPPTTSNGNWVTHKKQGIYPGANAKWMRVYFSRVNGGSSGDVYVDSMSAAYQADEANLYRGTDMTYAGALGEWQNALWNSPGLFQSYDFGNLYYDDTGSPPLNKGIGVEVRKDGLYTLSFQGCVGCDTIANFLRMTMAIRVMKNETYTGSRVPSGAGEVLFQGQPQVGILASESPLSWGTAAGAPNWDYYAIATCSASVNLVAGDRVTVEWIGRRVISGGPDDVAVSLIGNDELINGTFFKIKLQQAD